MPQASQHLKNRSKTTKLRRRPVANCHIESALNAKGVKRRELAGREYLVAPITLIVPGVLNGSQGPGLYTKEENGKNIRAWNGMPLLVGHPTAKEGSGRSIDVMSKRYLGFIADVKNGDNLTGMAWFDVQAMNSVPRGKEVLNLLRNKRPLEISTGLDVQKGKGKGVDNSGAEYEWKAENYQPDHVAVLLDEKGACSNDDGCGINNGADMADNNCGIGEDGFEGGNDCAKGGGGGGSGKSGGKKSGGSSAKPLTPKEAKKLTISQAAEHLAARGYKVEGVLQPSAATGWKAMYEVTQPNGDTVPMDVKEIRSILTKNSINNEEDDMKLNKAQRKTLIDNIVKNGCDCYTEEDRESLEEYTDDRLTAIDNHLKTHADNVAFVANAKGKSKDAKNFDAGKVAKRRMLNEMSDEEWDAEMAKRAEKKKAAENKDDCANEDDCDDEEPVIHPSKNQRKKSVEDYLKDKSIPLEIRNALNRQLKAEKKQRQKFIDTLVENKEEDQQEALANIYNRMETDELELLVQNLEDDLEEDDEDGDEEEFRSARNRRRSVKNRGDRYEDQDDYSDYSGRGVARTQNTQVTNRIRGSVPTYEDLFPVINGHKVGKQSKESDEE